MGGTGEEKNVFGTRLAENRRLCGFTQEEFAGRLGVTPQALSKWERGSSFPDLMMLVRISELLGVGADYLLGTAGSAAEAEGERKQTEIGKRLRGSLEPLQLIFGEELLPLFVDNAFMRDVADKRRELAAEGILMPVLRVMDQLRLKPREFMILSYQNVLYHEVLEDTGADKLAYIMRKLGEVVRSRYDEILNADLVKQLTDNLQIDYPALITGTVPEKISYGLLLDVLREIIRRGDSVLFLPRIIERMEHEMRENAIRSATELAKRVGEWLERPDNFYVFLHEREQA